MSTIKEFTLNIFKKSNILYTLMITKLRGFLFMIRY